MDTLVKKWGDETAGKSIISGLDFPFEIDKQYEKCTIQVDGHAEHDTNGTLEIFLGGVSVETYDYGLDGTQSRSFVIDLIDLVKKKNVGWAPVTIKGEIHKRSIFRGAGATITVTIDYKEVKNKTWGDETISRSNIERLAVPSPNNANSCVVLAKNHEGKATNIIITVTVGGIQKLHDEFWLDGNRVRAFFIDNTGGQSIEVNGYISNHDVVSGGGADISVIYDEPASTEKDIFEGWAYKTDIAPDYADHAYVSCRKQKEYFDCFGGHKDPDDRSQDNRRICSGLGDYSIAYKYLEDGSGHHNAHLGKYMEKGVCHQAANCFLYSAGITLNREVRGYWASVLAYGVYGKDHDKWLKDVYEPSAQPRSKQMGDSLLETKEHDPLFKKVDNLRKSYIDRSNKPHFHEIIIEESALITKHYAPEVDTSSYQDLHRQLLKDKDALIDSGVPGKELAQKLNALYIAFQKNVATIIGAEAYEKLTGVKAGEVFAIVDPQLVEESK